MSDTRFYRAVMPQFDSGKRDHRAQSTGAPMKLAIFSITTPKRFPFMFAA
jgi:hypothetical protein